MSIIQTKKAELNDLETIRLISGVMRDVSVNQIKGLRDSFYQNLEFYQAMGQLFNKVKQLINQYHGGLAAEMKNRPRAHIAITSNHRFFGTLNQEVMRAFLADWNQADDHLVIGRTGQAYLEPDPHYEKTEFSHFAEDNPNRREVLQLVGWTKRYDQVLVYYPQYKDPFHQLAARMNVTQAPASEEQEDLDRYIFEPDLPIIHDFFTTQVQYVLIQRVMLETNLSRTATRLLRMDTATHTASDMLVEAKRELRRTIQTQLDLQLLESIAGAAKWRQ